ncbi:MAG: diguanylate cyclase (GGDEF)-like protein [Planctomycetota bacterium]|jgi:diguanylate cyclase (GGDEF)-like protein
MLKPIKASGRLSISYTFGLSKSQGLQNKALLYFLPAAGCAISFLYFVSFLFELGYFYGGVVNLIFSAVYLTTFLFYVVDRVNIGKHFLSIIFLIHITLQSTYLFPKESFFQLHLLIAIPLVFMLFDANDKHARRIYSILVILLLAIIQLRTDHTIRPFNFLTDDITLTRNYNIFSSFVLLSLSALIYFRFNEKQVDETLNLAATDPLTGLQNRRGFFPLANQLYRRAKRENIPLSLLYIDIDHFKQINDQFGHLAGDQSLAGIASSLQQRSRESDVLARLGGDEFVLLMPNTNLDSATQLAGEVQQSIPIRFQAEQGRDLTLCIGVAQLNDQDKGVEDLLQRADQALYRAKSNGRNRVESH